MRILLALAIFLGGILVGVALAAALLLLVPESRLHISSLPQASPTPTARPQPSVSPLPFPTINSSLNFASGDFETDTDTNNCKMLVRFAALSNPDGSGGRGSISLTAVQKAGCEGHASGRITCLLVSGNHASFSGWLDENTGIFDMGNVVLGTITQDDPQTYGPPVDRAGIGIAGGSPECPPSISGTGPAIISGTLQVAPASPK